MSAYTKSILMSPETLQGFDLQETRTLDSKAKFSPVLGTTVDCSEGCGEPTCNDVPITAQTTFQVDEAGNYQLVVDGQNTGLTLSSQATRFSVYSGGDYNKDGVDDVLIVAENNFVFFKSAIVLSRASLEPPAAVTSVGGYGDHGGW